MKMLGEGKYRLSLYLPSSNIFMKMLGEGKYRLSLYLPSRNIIMRLAIPLAHVCIYEYNYVCKYVLRMYIYCMSHKI